MRDIQDLRFHVKLEESYIRQGGIEGELLYSKRNSVSRLEEAIQEWVGVGVNFELKRADKHNLYYEYVKNQKRVYDLTVEVPIDLKSRDFAMLLSFAVAELEYNKDLF